MADGSLSVQFTIYDASATGTCRYTTRGTCGTPTAKTVTVTNGVFSTLLGDTASGDNATLAPIVLGQPRRLDDGRHSGPAYLT